MNDTRAAIILVDDNHDNLRVLTAILKNHGYEVRPTTSGEMALAAISEKVPELILLDIMMPGMTGYEVCERLKADERTRHVPVIFISALDEIVDKVKGFTLGAVDYITKPFREEEVRVRVQTHIELRRLQKRLENQNVKLERVVSERTAKLASSLDNLKRAQKELIQSEKMAALGSIVAGFTHELCTPMGVIKSEASYLEEKSREFMELHNEKKLTRTLFDKFMNTLVETSASIVRNADSMGTQISSFKDVSVDQSSERKRVFGIKEQIDKTLLNLRAKLKRTKYEISINCPEELVIESFPGAFSQIVTNLVINTLRHGFETIEEGEIHFDISVEKDFLRFAYRDNGSGMDERTLKHVFDPFFTTKRDEGGSGLGMNIVYNLVTQKLGGQIQCVSSLGKGTEFLVTIPYDPIPQG